jgi:hypothetical protein
MNYKTNNLSYEFIIYHLKRLIKREQLNNEYQVIDENYNESK